VCDPNTKEHFYDLLVPSEHCITDQKIRMLQARLKEDKNKVNAILPKLEQKRTSKQIANSDYDRALAILEGVSREDKVHVQSSDGKISGFAPAELEVLLQQFLTK
jgi:hypothetical protein